MIPLLFCSICLQEECTGPPKAGAYKQRKNMRPTRFRMFYERGDLPVSLDSYALGARLRWRVRVRSDVTYNIMRISLSQCHILYYIFAFISFKRRFVKCLQKCQF